MASPTTQESKILQFLGIFPIVLFATSVTKRFWKWDFDDGFIVYRYVENILAGHGWVYNPGENYNASTSPLNTILTTILTYFTGNVFISAHLIGFLSLITLGVATHYLLGRSMPAWFSAGFAALIVFLMGNNFTWGLESNLFFALLMTFICLDAYGKTSWVLLGFIVLARPDALLLVALCGARALFINKVFPLKGLIFFSLVILPWAVFSFYNFGNVFPATLKQKMWQGSSGFWGTGFIFYDGIVAYIKGSAFYHLSGVYWAPVILVIPLILTPQGILQVVREKSFSVALLAAYLFSVLLVYTVLNVPNYHWYYVGIIMLSYTCAAYGIFFVIKEFSFLNARFLNVVLIFALATVAAGLLYKTKSDFTDLRTEVYKQLSEKINAKVDSKSKIAAVEVGVFGYYIKNPVIDIVGLTTPYGEFLTGTNNDKFFEELKPEVIIMHNPLMLHEQAIFGDPRFSKWYTQKDVVSTPGYSELSFYMLSPERPFKQTFNLNFLNSNDVTKEAAENGGGTFITKPSDPWIEYGLNKEMELTEPFITFEYDLTGAAIKEGMPVFGRVYFAASGAAYAETFAIPMVLKGGSNHTAVLNLSLPGSAKNKPLKIQRVRIDPIQDFNLMADSKFALRKASIAGF